MYGIAHLRASFYQEARRLSLLLWGEQTPGVQRFLVKDTEAAEVPLAVDGALKVISPSI
jgi:hypothetical protein